MKKFKITLKSKSPYMQHRMDDTKLEQWEKSHNLIITRPDVSKEDSTRDEYHCYRNENGQCYIPSEHIRGAIINAGTMVKSKVGARSKSMKTTIAGQYFIEPEQIIIPDYDQIDKRSAVNKNIKARVISIRPKWSEWKITFNCLVDNDSTTLEMVTQIFTFAGSDISIGSFRPTNNGMFGRFEIFEIKEIK